MNFRLLATGLAALLALSCQAADKLGLHDTEADVAANLVAQAVGDAVPPADPRVAKARDWLARTAQATGEEEKAIAAGSVRLSRHLFDVTKQRISPLDVLEALARDTPASKSMHASMNRYFELRAKRKLDHAGALAALR